MRRKIIASIAILMVIATGTIVTNNFTNNRSTTIANEEQKGTTWTKVENPTKTYVNCLQKQDFDLDEQTQNADYVFKGFITNCEEFEVQWQDETGQQWGPYPSSIITVKINEEYAGESPVSGESIKVYYPYSVSMEFSNAFKLLENHEYIFVTQALDNEFIEQRNKENPDDKFEQEKYADVYISDTGYDVMAVENNQISMYKSYFDNQNIIDEQEELSISDDVTPEKELYAKNEFLVLDETSVIEKLYKLFDNINLNNKKEAETIEDNHAYTSDNAIKIEK